MSYENVNLGNTSEPEKPQTISLPAFDHLQSERIARIEHSRVETNWNGELCVTDFILVTESGKRIRISPGGKEYWEMHGKHTFEKVNIQQDLG